MRSNFGKEFAYYIPHKFEEKNTVTDTQLGFYWINGDQLVTVKNSNNAWFRSIDEWLIFINGMRI